MLKALAEESARVIERMENSGKEKKNKRKSNRRSKQDSECATEDHGEASDDRTTESKDGNLSSQCASSKQQILDSHNSDELGVMRASNVAFNSTPPMHYNRRVETVYPGSSVHLLAPCADISEQMLSKSCPEPRDCEQSPMMKGDLFQKIEGSSQRMIFSSHWSLNAANEALEQKGDVFKAIFRVNAYNRSEAYCKIDGLPTDILINGNVSQNRAVEGDIVFLKLDPFSLWPKMKGYVSENVAAEETPSPQKRDESVRNIDKGKGEINVDIMEAFEDGPSENESSLSVIRQRAENCVSSSSEQRGSSVEILCGILRSFPYKRPTGQVVAIVEKSLIRESIVGFLDVKGWIHFKEDNSQKSKSPFSLFDEEYVQLMPADPKLPKLIVPLLGLPGSIRARLESVDATLEAELVGAKIVDWGEGSPCPLAHVTHIFGRGSELEPQINAILYQNSISHSDFSPESLTCLPCVPWEVPKEEVQCRKDLRNLCIFTIDPSTATGLDDALSVESLPHNILRVGVHIADVSYFVLLDTALDKEARFRSTSVYMVQRKVPMLPPLLSENVGSLKPGADRLTFSIFWDINMEGDVINRWIGRTVIRSCCKLSYDHAQDIIDRTDEMLRTDFAEDGWPVLHGPFEWSDVTLSVRLLNELSTVLREKRFRSGALHLENSKPGFLFDEDGAPYEFVSSNSKGSNFLVEEFMLLANMTAAEVISRAYPDKALLRRHPEPNMRKLKELQGFCSKHGVDFDISSSRQFQESLVKITEKLKDDDPILVDILNSYAARPMQLASYFCTGNLKDNVSEWGHYALAVPFYTHFTSPLRRYPDIVVHRAIAATIEAEELYSKHKASMEGTIEGTMEGRRCFTGIHFDTNAAQSQECKIALSVAASNHGVPCTEALTSVAAHCNERKLASGKVEDACDKLYTWLLLKKKEILPCEATVMNLGPRFMTIYISKLGMERRIHYDHFEGLLVDWLESTSTLILDKLFRRCGRGNFKPLKKVAYVVSPRDISASDTNSSNDEIVPVVFPLTVRDYSTIPVVLHAVGGDDGPLEIGARLYMTSYHT